MTFKGKIKVTQFAMFCVSEIMVSYDQSLYEIHLIIFNESERANQGHPVLSELYFIDQPCCE